MKNKYVQQKKDIISKKEDALKRFECSWLVCQCQIEHTRPRSPKNFISNRWTDMIAYTFLDKRPPIKEFQMKKQIKNMVLLEDYS